MKENKKTSIIVGICLLGYLGLCGFVFTTDGYILGNIFYNHIEFYVCLGGSISQEIGIFAGNKLSKFIKKKQNLTEFDLFIFKLESLINWLIIEKKKYKYNLNTYRMILEKVLLIINFKSNICNI